MAIPNVPSNVLVQPGNGQVFVSWTPSVGAISGSTGVPSGSTGAYDILRSQDGGVNFSLLTSVNTNQYYDSPSTGMLLYYSVRANGNNGQSNQSAPIVTTVVGFGQISLGQVRLAAQQRADLVNSDFVTTQEWNFYINKSYTELYDILIQVYADDYYVATPYQFNTDGRFPAIYALPNNFYKLLGVDLGLNPNNNAYITLKKFPFIDRNSYLFGSAPAGFLGVNQLRYRVLNNNIWFIPQPQSNQQVQLWYIPRPVTLLADSDVLDGVSGWDEYIVVDAAIKAMQKEESDVSVLMAEKQALLMRITSAASNRDAGMSEVASNMRRLDGSYSYDPLVNGPIGGY